jgi:preprotein translocase subunit SecA
VDIDYVRYITHVEATAAPSEATDADEGLEGALTNANQVAPGATELPAHATTTPATPAPPATFGRASSGPAAQREKLGRNDVCWCGSGRKFGKCHGRP